MLKAEMLARADKLRDKPNTRLICASYAIVAAETDQDDWSLIRRSGPGYSFVRPEAFDDDIMVQSWNDYQADQRVGLRVLPLRAWLKEVTAFDDQSWSRLHLSALSEAVEINYLSQPHLQEEPASMEIING